MDSIPSKLFPMSILSFVPPASGKSPESQKAIPRMTFVLEKAFFDLFVNFWKILQFPGKISRFFLEWLKVGKWLSLWLSLWDFVLRTTSVSPLDRDKDGVLDPKKMLSHFSVAQRVVLRIFSRTRAGSTSGLKYSRERFQNSRAFCFSPVAEKISPAWSRMTGSAGSPPAVSAFWI